MQVTEVEDGGSAGPSSTTSLAQQPVLDLVAADLLQIANAAAATAPGHALSHERRVASA